LGKANWCGFHRTLHSLAFLIDCVVIVTVISHS
jgi:hypothetical protein